MPRLPQALEALRLFDELKWLNARQVRGKFDRVCTRLNIHNIWPYDLRHSFAVHAERPTAGRAERDRPDAPAPGRTRRGTPGVDAERPAATTVTMGAV